ncbi:MAG: choice-of-anchor Q domain-containing protein [Limisphaerales bacterium]
MKTALCLTVITLMPAVLNLSAATLYVSQGSTNPTPPYTNWATAATNIQQALDAAAAGDEVVVTDGVYSGGLLVTNPLALQSVNGPQFTVVDGGSMNRCVSLTNGASLSGFTLTNGYAYGGDGGGVWCASANAFLTNCVIGGNWARPALMDPGKGGNGGGAQGGTLYNCTLTRNYASDWFGGGSYGSTLYNCSLTYNEAYEGGGGAYGSTLYNCTLTSNSTTVDGGGADGCTLYNCTLTSNGTGNGDLNYGSGGGAYGSALTNCTLRGNGAYWGGGACASTLSNCTLRDNAVVGYEALGGGADGCTLFNCTLAGNWASGEYNSGGGACGGALYNCSLTGNSAQSGGGSYQATLYNCTLTGNLSSSGTNAFGGDGGGAYGGVLYNCIVYFNTGAPGENIGGSGLMNYCCTTPLPTNGVGNITNAPLFVDYAGGNLRLQSGSPCIDAGWNGYVTTTTDLDGRPRIVGGTVDMGAYEFQQGVSGAFVGWLQQYGLPTNGSADFIDSDGDGLNNWQEWICGTCPTNPLSTLRLLSPSIASTNATVTWQSVAGVTYFLERSTNLASPFTHLASFLMGQPGTTSYADTNVAGAGPLFYRVGVLPPGAN